MTIQEKFRNSFLLSAIGDALGMPVEGFSRDQIKSQYGVVKDYLKPPEGHPLYHLEPGQYTDDYQQMQIIADTLIEEKYFDMDVFIEKFADWGQKNIDERNNPKYWWRFPGSSSIKAAKKLKKGIPWEDAGSNNPTCGSAMRVAPIGLFYHNDYEMLTLAAVNSSLPSHSHLRSKTAALAVAYAVGLAANNEFYLSEVSKVTKRYDREFSNKIQKLSDHVDDTIPYPILSKIGNSWMADETVCTALYCAARHLDEPEEALILAINNGGDTDSIACITGGIVGAANDGDCIPERWLETLEDREKIEETAQKLFDGTK